METAEFRIKTDIDESEPCAGEFLIDSHTFMIARLDHIRL